MMVALIATASAAAAAAPPLPTPTPQQLHYMDSELTMFMHFSVCTFNDGCDGGQQNCGYHHERQPWPASSFDPTDVNTEQWAQTALDLGAKQVCLTVHHSGGFALWPTKASNYSITASPFGKSGRDIAREFVTSMRKHGLEPCFYTVLNMDCAESHTTVEKYYEIQRDMLTELLTLYGPIPRMWWDMVSSNLSPEYNPGGFPALFKNLSAHAKSLAPQTLLIPGTDGCLVGGESGSGSYPVYNFNQGPTGYGCQRMDSPPVATAATIFAPHEQDHTILNPGDMWWWVKGHVWFSAAELFETYLVTIGRGNTYILNMPPNTTGVIPEYLTNESAQLGRAVKASFAPETAIARMTDLTVGCGADNATNYVELKPPAENKAGLIEFDALVLEEDLQKGNQRISGYEIQACHAAGGGACSEAEWVTITAAGRAGVQTVSLGQTVGRRVIERGFNDTNGLTMTATSLRFRCTAAFPAPSTKTAFLKSFSAHKMQPPRGWPKPQPPPFSCQAFNCTCKGMADYYGVKQGSFGCAPAASKEWWVKEARPCEKPGWSCCAISDYTTKSAPYPGCHTTSM